MDGRQDVKQSLAVGLRRRRGDRRRRPGAGPGWLDRVAVRALRTVDRPCSATDIQASDWPHRPHGGRVRLPVPYFGPASGGLAESAVVPGVADKPGGAVVLGIGRIFSETDSELNPFVVPGPEMVPVDVCRWKKATRVTERNMALSYSASDDAVCAKIARPCRFTAASVGLLAAGGWRPSACSLIGVCRTGRRVPARADSHQAFRVCTID